MPASMRPGATRLQRVAFERHDQTEDELAHQRPAGGDRRDEAQDERQEHEADEERQSLHAAHLTAPHAPPRVIVRVRHGIGPKP